MLAAYDAQIKGAKPGTPEHAQAWRDRTTYAALNHPDSPPAWMNPEQPDYGHVPEAVTAELDAQAAQLAAVGTRGTEVWCVGGQAEAEAG
jgi:hypothetical protein